MPVKKDLFESPDYYKVDELFTEEQLMVRNAVRAYVKKEISPVIEDYAQRAVFPQQIVKQLGDLGCFGPTVPQEYGGGGLDYISYGLMMQELERGDSGVRSTASVQGSLVMFPILAYGSEAQKHKYLPKLASGEWLGCFGLTEPDHGSDPAGMQTHFIDSGNDVVLNGAKMWISNAPFAQVAIVWAKDEEDDVRGIIVERGMDGFSTPATHNKWSLRLHLAELGEALRSWTRYELLIASALIVPECTNMHPHSTLPSDSDPRALLMHLSVVMFPIPLMLCLLTFAPVCPSFASRCSWKKSPRRHST